jgi:hypothetical protein
LAEFAILKQDFAKPSNFTMRNPEAQFAHQESHPVETRVAVLEEWRVGSDEWRRGADSTFKDFRITMDKLADAINNLALSQVQHSARCPVIAPLSERVTALEKDGNKLRGGLVVIGVGVSILCTAIGAALGRWIH